MITWLQKNKKYTQTAIWISTIAFVGAGFVGWGAYDYNANRANAVASVGDKKITNRELQISYNTMYNYYNKMSGGKFNKEEAKKINLQGLALEQLINQKTILNIANEFGLDSNDEDIKARLANTKEFQTNGVFDKTKYYNLLSNANMTSKDYENQLQNQILAEKLISILNIKITPTELQTINAAKNLQDRVSIDILKPDMNIQLSENEIKSKWEQTKNLYPTLKSYDISIFKIALDQNIDDSIVEEYYTNNKNKYSDLNESKNQIIRDIAYENAYKNAKQKYIYLKKSKIDFTDNVTVDETSDFPITKIQTLKIGETSKPIKTYNGYLIAKLTKVNPAIPMSYEQAKNLVTNDLKKERFKEQLKQISNDKLEKFKGKDIGYVSLLKYDIDGLDTKESFNLVKQIFASDKKSGFLVLDDKSVVYKITDQKLGNDDNLSNKSLLNNEIQSIKISSLQNSLIELYKDKYKINYFIK